MSTLLINKWGVVQWKDVYKRVTLGPCGKGTALYHYVNIQIVIYIVPQVFKMLPLGGLSKEYSGSLCVIS